MRVCNVSYLPKCLLVITFIIRDYFLQVNISHLCWGVFSFFSFLLLYLSLFHQKDSELFPDKIDLITTVKQICVLLKRAWIFITNLIGFY